MKAEEALQRAVVQLLGIYENRGLLAFCHCPNGERRDPVTGARLKAMGVRAGVPDLLIWLPGGKSVGVELKAGQGSRVSTEQFAWICRVARLGHGVHVCRSVDEVEAVLRLEGVPGIGQIAQIRSLSAVKPLAGVTEPENVRGHSATLARPSGAIE